MRNQAQTKSFQEQLNEKMNSARSEARKQAAYSLNTGSNFSLSAGLNRAKTYFQTLVGGISTGLQRLTFGIKNIFSGKMLGSSQDSSS